MSFDEWKKVKLGDLINFRRGHDLPKKNMIVGKYPVIGSNGVIGFHNEFTTVRPCITVGRSGNVGNPHIIDFEAWAHNTTLYIDDFKNNYPQFIYYLLKTLELSRFAGGSAVPTLNRNHIHPIELNVPTEIDEQKAIANILSTLDEKIEVNNQINQTLENMAQELFKRWFVDFEFPNEDGAPYQSSGGEMIESELGLIPKGWEVNSLKTIIELHDSKRIPLSKNERTKRDKIYPYYGAASLMDYVDDYLFDGTFILLGEDGTVMTEDYKPILQYVWGKFWVNNHAHVLKSKRDISINFLYLMLRNMNISSAVTGAVQLKINQKNLKSMKIVLPTDENLIGKFSRIIDDSFESYKVLNEENKILKQVRDTLLPKLMSGEIRVPLEGLEESLTEVKGG
ncbi:restriction endonuclease subunit S [Alkalibacterium pelagium]|uniref:Type I restriction enzyme, S subunit n=1 Tax=Alkalibacterium pelagium TaxID=426702 RepID=A0A1H7J327_9LACT|nr:restriction endonuclease subunit S [Alkalibacterium pelagium]GEN50263.1 type I restriction-modification system subunit S [Alkalibacterium pelagium]SEK69078.1 type I restriction enzyme, S subunit [Alkalibacterium pelagium]